MLKRVIIGFGLLSLLLFSKQPVEGIRLFKAVFEEKMVWENPGRKVRKIVPVQKVEKGATLIYVNQIINTTYETKRKVVVDNPIPYGAVYIRGTSSCEGTCKMLYSIDGGLTYKESEELFVQYGKKKRPAMGSEYTHIKYIFDEVLPHAKIRMAFKAKVK